MFVCTQLAAPDRAGDAVLYELLTNYIPADVIIKTLTKAMLKVMDYTVKHELVHWATHYEHASR